MGVQMGLGNRLGRGMRGLEGGVWSLPGGMACWDLIRLCEDGSQHGFTRSKSFFTNLRAFYNGVSRLVDEVIRGHTDVVCLN